MKSLGVEALELVRVRPNHFEKSCVRPICQFLGFTDGTLPLWVEVGFKIWMSDVSGSECKS